MNSVEKALNTLVQKIDIEKYLLSPRGIFAQEIRAERDYIEASDLYCHDPEFKIYFSFRHANEEKKESNGTYLWAYVTHILIKVKDFYLKKGYREGYAAAKKEVREVLFNENSDKED